MAIEISKDTVVKILVRRGTDAERQLTTLTEGELGYCIDTQRVYVGDGVTPGGVITGNRFLGSINLKNSFNSIAAIGDLVYQSGGTLSEAEVLNAYVGGATQWIDVHPKPYVGPTNNKPSLEKATDGKWRVSRELLGDGLTLTYDDQGTVTDSLPGIQNRIDFDSRYVSLCAQETSWFFGDYGANYVKNNLDATVNVQNSFFINGLQPSNTHQLRFYATDPNNSSAALIYANLPTASHLNIKSDNRVSLFSDNYEGYRLEYIDATQTLTTTFSSHNNGRYSSPNFQFIGTTRFSEDVFFDVNSDVTMYGNLSVLGEVTYLDTVVTTTSALSVINKNNNVNALYVAQLNAGASTSQGIALFKENQTNRTILTIKEQAYVGINQYDFNNYTTQYTFCRPYPNNSREIPADGSYNLVTSGSSLFLPSPETPTSSKFRVHMGNGDIYFGVNQTGRILFDAGSDTSFVTVSGNVRVSEDVIAFAISDKRVKDNVTPIPNALEKIDKITGVSFDWKPESGHIGHDYGIIAQEVEEILPEIVTTRSSGYKAVKYEKVIPLLIQAIKELKNKVN